MFITQELHKEFSKQNLYTIQYVLMFSTQELHIEFSKQNLYTIQYVLMFITQEIHKEFSKQKLYTIQYVLMFSTQELHKEFSQEVYSVAIHPSGHYVIVGFAENVRVMNVLIDDLRIFHEIPVKACKEVSDSCHFNFWK